MLFKNIIFIFAVVAFLVPDVSFSVNAQHADPFYEISVPNNREVCNGDTSPPPPGGSQGLACPSSGGPTCNTDKQTCECMLKELPGGGYTAKNECVDKKEEDDGVGTSYDF